MPLCFAQLDGAFHLTAFELDSLFKRTNFKTVYPEHLDTLPASHVESSPANKRKLEKFRAKVKRHLLSMYQTDGDLVAQVISSFVLFIKASPRTGYVRADKAVDYRKYAELLEENDRLRSQLAVASARSKQAEQKDVAPVLPQFLHEKMVITFTATCRLHDQEQLERRKIDFSFALDQLFLLVCRSIIEDDSELFIFSKIISYLSRRVMEEGDGNGHQILYIKDGYFELDARQKIRESLYIHGMFDITTQREPFPHQPPHQPHEKRKIVDRYWTITPYGTKLYNDVVQYLRFEKELR